MCRARVSQIIARFPPRPATRLRRKLLAWLALAGLSPRRRSRRLGALPRAVGGCVPCPPRAASVVPRAAVVGGGWRGSFARRGRFGGVFRVFRVFRFSVWCLFCGVCSFWSSSLRRCFVGVLCGCRSGFSSFVCSVAFSGVPGSSVFCVGCVRLLCSVCVGFSVSVVGGGGCSSCGVSVRVVGCVPCSCVAACVGACCLVACSWSSSCLCPVVVSFVVPFLPCVCCAWACVACFVGGWCVCSAVSSWSGVASVAFGVCAFGACSAWRGLALSCFVGCSWRWRGGWLSCSRSCWLVGFFVRFCWSVLFSCVCVGCGGRCVSCFCCLVGVLCLAVAFGCPLGVVRGVAFSSCAFVCSLFCRSSFCRCVRSGGRGFFGLCFSWSGVVVLCCSSVGCRCWSCSRFGGGSGSRLCAWALSLVCSCSRCGVFSCCCVVVGSVACACVVASVSLVVVASFVGACVLSRCLSSCAGFRVACVACVACWWRVRSLCGLSAGLVPVFFYTRQK